MAKFFLTLVALTFLALIGVAGYVYSEFADAASKQFQESSQKNIEFTIKRGTGPKRISADLEKAGVIKDQKHFYRYLRFIVRQAAKLKAGEYELSPSMSYDQLIAELSTGQQKERKFTIQEGLRKEEIAKIIAKSGLSTEKELLVAMKDPKLRAEFGVPTVGAGGQNSIPGGIEGYLFPDTYQFPKTANARSILRKMRARLKEIITPKMKNRMSELGWKLHKVLTMAAIVEKETGQKHERPHISSVFHNRLKKKMKFQTDPTVIYGIKNYDGNIRKKDLLTPHPYNTYTFKGFPPGPIASPGLEAIKAALWPTNDKDIFFVSRNDGTHIFCPTLTCHNKAVQKWQVRYFRKKR